MYFKLVANSIALALLVAYYAPVVIKLDSPPLTLVALAGLVLAVIDALQSLRE